METGDATAVGIAGGRRGLTALWLMAALCCFTGCASLEGTQAARAHQVALAEPMTPIKTTARLKAYARANEDLRAQFEEKRRRLQCEQGKTWFCPQRKQQSCSDCLDRVEVVGSRIAAADVITNNQESGVDEGDIVKKSGRYLLILRRGWLQVVDSGTAIEPDLRLVGSLRVATDPTGETVWYDEILTFGSRLILVGYNYAEDVAELLSFEVDVKGKLSRDGRYWLRVQDYFNASNYGTRIEGDNLLMFLAMPLDEHDERTWPSWSRRDTVAPTWQSLVELDQVYLPVAVALQPVIHLVLRCPLVGLAGDQLKCRTIGVVGEQDAQSYATADAAYLAVTHWERDALLDPRFDYYAAQWQRGLSDLRKRRYTAVYRIAFDDTGPPLTVGLFEGLPGTQFSFKQTDQALFVVMEPAGAETGREAILQRLDLANFSIRPGARAQTIERLALDSAHLTYRFDDDALWLGAHGSILREENYENPTRPLRPAPPILVQPLDGSPLQRVELRHSADSMEPISGAMVVSGIDSAQDWQVSVVPKNRPAPVSLRLDGYRSSEDRSHAFNYTRWTDGSILMGWPGAPLAENEDDLEQHWGAWETISDLVFLRWNGRDLTLAGAIDMQSGQSSPDCADTWACYDWYGNARLFFIGQRIFALSGSRLVEARFVQDRVEPLRVVELRD